LKPFSIAVPSAAKVPVAGSIRPTFSGGWPWACTAVALNKARLAAAAASRGVRGRIVIAGLRRRNINYTRAGQTRPDGPRIL